MWHFARLVSKHTCVTMYVSCTRFNQPRENFMEWRVYHDTGDEFKHIHTEHNVPVGVHFLKVGDEVTTPDNSLARVTNVRLMVQAHRRWMQVTVA